MTGLTPPDHDLFEKPTYNKKYPRRIAVKLYDDITIPPGDDVGNILEENKIVPWYELAERFPGLRIGQLITDQQNQDIEERLARAKESQEFDPTYHPPTFLNFLIVTVPLNQEPEEVARSIKELWGGKVEAIKIRSLPASSPAVTPDDEGDISKQGYIESHNPAAANPTDRTYGVDARYAWENWGDAGGAGAGVKFIDLEHGWFLDHIDLPVGIPVLHGVNIGDIPGQDFPDINLNPAQEQAHGTWTLGVVAAADNGHKILGIAAEAEAAVVSPWKLMDVPLIDDSESPYEHDIAQAILGAIWHLEFGDVLLLEAQIRSEGVGEESKYEPVELEFDTFSMIRLATALGIIVIEAAGNGRYVVGEAGGGAHDLATRTRRDDPDTVGIHVLDKDIWTTEEATANYDSKAIIVGAATHEYPHHRVDNTMVANCSPPPFPGLNPLPSNYGSRVDCYAWGQCVYTIGDVTGNINSVTAIFNGTSSASAIVAGVAIVTQAVARHLPIPIHINSELMRTIFHNHGIESANPLVDRIRKMPNLQLIIDNALGLPDVYIRDYVGDNGEPHNAGIISRSPDIIVLQDTVANLGIDLGSTTESLDNLNQPVEQGQTNYVYVRVKNKGNVPAKNVTADVYYALPSTLIAPPWNMVGSVTIPTVPVGDILTVSDAIEWNDIPDVDHYCFVAIIGHENDPAPHLAQFGNFEWYYAFIRQNNNVAWRNFNVVDDISDEGAAAMSFLVAGPPDRPRRMHLEVVPRLPRGAQLWLESDPRFLGRLRVDQRRLMLGLEDRSVRLPLNPHQITHFGPVSLRRRERTPVQLRVKIPMQWRAKGPYDVFVRQLYRGVEVGRITWRLNPL